MKIIVGRELLHANNDQAGKNRELFEQKGVAVVNLISSPGSGKTTLLEKTAGLFKGSLRMGVIVGDLFTDRDARRLEGAGATAVQINTGGLCHLTADMVARAARELPLPALDLLFIENVGNLVCPAAFDLGEHVKVAVLSVTEGMDKPAKYPGIFREAGAAVISKEDLLPHTDFHLPACLAELREINARMDVFVTSARTGRGLDAWCAWLKTLAGRTGVSRDVSWDTGPGGGGAGKTMGGD